MRGKIAVVMGAIVSGMLGYVIFLLTGLCDACKTDSTRYIIGFVIVAVYIWSFRRGMRGRPALTL